jgi:hypothetical protein
MKWIERIPSNSIHVSEVTKLQFHPDPLLSVQWITPDEGQRNCPKYVEFHFQNKFEKLVHLVGFIIRKFVTMHAHMNVKKSLKTVWCFLTCVHSVGVSICTSSRCYWKSFVSSGLGAANGLDSLQMWKVAANILNERRRTENKGWSLLLGVGRDAKNPSPLNLPRCRVLQNNVKGGILWTWEETIAFHWRYGIAWPAVWLLAPQNAPRWCVVATTRIHSQTDYSHHNFSCVTVFSEICFRRFCRMR